MSDDLPPIDPAPAKRAPGTSRGVRVALYLSLAVNLLIVGAIAGAIAIGRPDRDGDPALRDAGLGPLAFVLTRAERDSLREELRAQTRELRQNGLAMRRDLADLLDALRAEPFDAGVFASVLDRLGETVVARQDIGHRALIDAVTKASAADRRDLADRIERALDRAGRRPDH